MSSLNLLTTRGPAAGGRRGQKYFGSSLRPFLLLNPEENHGVSKRPLQLQVYKLCAFRSFATHSSRRLVHITSRGTERCFNGFTYLPGGSKKAAGTLSEQAATRVCPITGDTPRYPRRNRLRHPLRISRPELPTLPAGTKCNFKALSALPTMIFVNLGT